MRPKRKQNNGAPIGNKNAVGHGRPPNAGYADQDLLVLGEEMLAWMKKEDESKSNIVHMSQFYSQYKNIARSQWKSICERGCFLPYYEKMKDWIGYKILTNEKLHQSYGNRFLPIYFKEIDDQEFEKDKRKIDYEYDKKAANEKNKATTPNDTTITSLLDWLHANKLKTDAIK
jgi:hypothetical protein